jgi:hypothetical protein
MTWVQNPGHGRRTRPVGELASSVWAAFDTNGAFYTFQALAAAPAGLPNGG